MKNGKSFKAWIGERFKSAKVKKTVISASVTFCVCLFYIWLGAGLFNYLPVGESERKIPLFLMYCVFPLVIIALAGKKMYIVYSKGAEDSRDEWEDEF